MNPNMRHTRCILKIALFWLGVGAPGLYGHSTYEAALILDFTGREARAELQLPLDRMSMGFGKSIDGRTLQTDGAGLNRYVLDRFHAQSPDRREFQIRLVAPLQIESVDGAPYV